MSPDPNIKIHCRAATTPERSSPKLSAKSTLIRCANVRVLALLPVHIKLKNFAPSVFLFLNLEKNKNSFSVFDFPPREVRGGAGEQMKATKLAF